ncbi:unnamed protein product [Symbiodinium sp. CCMP2592]|nr:unnamed protein product [Symbiodinium sp. CCMP2592]
MPLLNISTQPKVLPRAGNKETLSLDEKRVATCSLQFAGQMVGFMMARCLEVTSLPNCNWKLVALLKRRRYDETPTRISLREKRSVRASEKEFGKQKVTTECAKVFQTELGLGLVLANKSSGQSLLMRFTMPTIMSCVDSASAENVKRAQLEAEALIASLDEIQSKVGHVFSLPCTDRASSNIKAEVDIGSQSASAVNCHFLCQVHKASQVQSKQFDHCERHISGLLHCALAMRGAGTRGELRKMLFEIIESRLSIHLGEAPPQYAEHRNCVLDLYVNGKYNQHGKSPQKRLALQRCILSYFFPGNIQDENVVEFYVREPTSRQEVLSWYKQWAIPMLLPSVCPIYPRSRWIGGECSLNWAGLLCSFHNLLKPLMLKFGAPRGFPAPAEAPRTSATLHTFQSGWDCVAVPAEVRPDESHESEHQTDAPDLEAEGWANSVDYNPFLAADSERDLLDRATGNVDWQRLNASMKLRAARWADRPDVGAALICMRSCMEPCLHLMHSLLELASLKFDRKQQSLVARGKVRDSRVVAVANLTVRVFQMINGKFRDTVRALPLQHMTRRTRVLLFRMLSRAGGGINMLMGRDQGYPFRLFHLLLSGQVEKIFQDPGCLYDELTTKLLMKFPDSKALTSLEGSSVVEALAEMISVDIAGVEARHAAARRINSIRSCQAHTMSFESLSSLTITRSLVKHRLDWLEARGLLPPKEKRRRRREAKEKKFHCGGGAWRAFLHLKKGGFAKSKALSPLYQQIKSQGLQEWQDLKEIGKMGTVSSRAGHASFGKRKFAGKKQLQAIAAPKALEQQLCRVAQACSQEALRDKEDWQQTVASVAKHASEECGRLVSLGHAANDGGTPVTNPAALLAKSMAPSMLPLSLSGSMLSRGLPAAEVPDTEVDGLDGSNSGSKPSMLSVECLPPVAELVKDGMEFFSTLPNRSGLLKELVEVTQSQSAMRLHCDAPSLSGVHRGLDFHEQECCKVAECVCGKHVNAQRIHANLVSLFRPFLRVKPAAKAKPDADSARQGSKPAVQKGKKPVPRLFMEQGLLVFKFTKLPPEGQMPSVDTSAGWDTVCQEPLADADQDSGQGVEQSHVDESIWVHVSYANFRDWHFSFLLLDEQPESQGTTDGRQLTVLRVPEPSIFLRDTVAFKQRFDLKFAWKAAMYIIFVDDSELAPLDMAPEVVEVLRLASVPELLVWKATVGCSEVCFHMW